VRGKAYHNTAAPERQSAQEQEAADELDVEGLIMRLAHDSRTENRKSAAEALRQLGPAATAAIPALLEAVTQTDPGVRQAALKALTAIDAGWPKLEAVHGVMPSWGKAMSRGDLQVNNDLERLLVQIGLPAVSGLVQALSDAGDGAGNIFVLRALGRIGPCAAGAVPEATRLLGSENPQVCIAAANALANIGHPAATAVPALTLGLTHWHSDVRQAMAFCLARVGPAAEPAGPALMQLLVDREDEVRKAAVAALEQIGPVTVPWLMVIVQTREVSRLLTWFKQIMELPTWIPGPQADDMRVDHFEALKNLSWKVYEALEERENLENAHIAALQLLGRFGLAASAAVPVIAEALTDPNPRVRKTAAIALGRIGAGARAAISALIKALRDGNSCVRDAAAEALAKIESASHDPDLPD
jgi:HEAT repeat protein